MNDKLVPHLQMNFFFRPLPPWRHISRQRSREAAFSRALAYPGATARLPATRSKDHSRPPQGAPPALPAPRTHILEA